MRVLITGGTGLIGKATAERLLQKGWQVRVIDRDARPCQRQKVLLGDGLTGAFNQDSQDVQRAAAKAAWLIAFQQEALCRYQPEWTEYPCHRPIRPGWGD